MTQIKKTHNIVVFRLLINKTEHGLIFILQYAAGREPESLPYNKDHRFIHCFTHRPNQ